MKLFRHNLFNLAIVAVAEVILMQICSEQVPSLNRLVPRYLKLVTSSNFWLFTLLFLVLLVTIFLCTVLTSILYALALSMSLLVRS